MENDARRRSRIGRSRSTSDNGRAGLDLETVREVLIAHMLEEQPLPVDFRSAPATEPKAPPLRLSQSK